MKASGFFSQRRSGPEAPGRFALPAGVPGAHPSGPTAIGLIAGVGNLLLSDDGVGIHAVRELQRQSLPGVTIVDLGTAVLHGLAFVECAQRVLILDAARGGRPPGTVYRFDVGAQSGIQWCASIHSLGLREAARLLLAEGAIPPMTVIGVEPASLEYGMDLSPAVQAALPRVLELARATVADWMRPRETAGRLARPERTARMAPHAKPEML